MASRAGTPSGNRRTGSTPPPRAREWQEAITVEPAGYVEMTDDQRREAVAAFTEILANWWRRHDRTPQPTSPVPRSAAAPDAPVVPQADM